MRRNWVRFLFVPVVLAGGVWALATLHLQTELLPLFPAKLASVRGVRLSLSIVSSAQDVTIVLTGPAATGEITEQLTGALDHLPEVRAVSVIGQSRLEPMVKLAGWVVANLPPEKFAQFRSLFTAEELAARLADTRNQLGGVVDPGEVFLRRVDPLQLLPWLQTQSPTALPLPDVSSVEPPPVIVIQVRARQPLRTFDECQNFVAAVRGAIEAAPRVRVPNVRGAIAITGQPAFVAENSSDMKSDITVMVVLATVLTALVLWLFYRSQSALLWMALVLVLALLAGAIAARVLFGELNVISIGFASILIGLGSDYCILVYHFHAVRHDNTAAEWRTTRRGIWLSAAATSLAFGMLCFSSLPGLQQLVTLIGVGLLATAFFATTLLPVILQRAQPVAPAWLATASDAFAAWHERQRRKIMAGTAVALLLAIGLWPVLRRHPFYDPDFNRLRPPHSEASRGLDWLRDALKTQRVFEVIVPARSWGELRAKAARIAPQATLLPQEDFLAANRGQWQPGRQAVVRAALDKAGFDEGWGRATVSLLDTLDAWVRGAEDFQSARMFLGNVTELPDGEKVALLRLPLRGDARATWEWVSRREPDCLPASWQLMIEDLQRSVLRDARRLSLWTLAAVAVVCWVARRSWWLATLNGLALIVATVGLLALLLVTRESMTLHSLLTVPVMVAVAIEYSLYLLLSLDDNAGDLRRTFRQLAVPVLLMGVTSIIGFGAPIATHQPMLKNFGLVMALGTLAAMVAGLVVVPAFYPARPRRVYYSLALYRATWFEAAAWIAKHGGVRVTRLLGRGLARAYDLTHPQTRAVVKRNLALLQQTPPPNRQAHQTLVNFGLTLADYFLLGTRPRAEVMALATEKDGFDHLQEGLDSGRGLIVATAHLGLFELGGLWLEEKGHPPVILTLPEPSPALNRWRAEYRKRWSATTLEVGNGYFSSVEVVRLLKQGRCVAMLMDRPYDTNRVLVDFPGGKVPFATGPVWLSLLSGCPIVAVTAVRLPDGGYRLAAFPPVHPHWLPAGRDETVRHYTTELGKIFREVICQYPDQWYQFVPLAS